MIDQRAGDGNALALAAGELTGLVHHSRFKPDVGESLPRARQALGGRRAVINQRQFDVVQRSWPGQGD